MGSGLAVFGFAVAAAFVLRSASLEWSLRGRGSATATVSRRAVAALVVLGVCAVALVACEPTAGGGPGGTPGPTADPLGWVRCVEAARGDKGAAGECTGAHHFSGRNAAYNACMNDGRIGEARCEAARRDTSWKD